LAGLVGIHSCQDVYLDENATSAWVLRTSSDSAVVPDSVSWHGPWEAGTGRTVRGVSEGRIQLDLRQDLGYDTLELTFDQMGVRQKSVWCVASDDSGWLKVVREREDSLGSALLGAFWRHRTVDPRNLEPATPMGLQTFLARRLLAGDSSFRPFPGRIPARLAVDTVRADVYVAACKSGWPLFRVLDTWNLGTDSCALRKGVESLVRSGRLAAGDTVALFLAPVRVRKDLSLGDFLQGDSIRPVGSFQWASGLDIQVEASVRLRNDPPDAIEVAVVSAPGAADTVWDASRGLVLRAGANTAVGLDTLLVRLKDRRGRYQMETRATFNVLPRPREVSRDTVAPILAHRTVSDSVDWSVRSIRVEWQVKDQGAGDSIWIGNVPTALSPTGFYSHDMALSVGANLAVFKAKDSAGNRAWDTIRIVRRADVEPPRCVRIPDSAKRTVPFDTSTTMVAWKVEDNRGVAACRIQGRSALQSSAGQAWNCGGRVDLSVGTNVVDLWVQDSSGNERVDTIRIDRLKDASTPTARPLAGQGSREVSFDSTSVWVGWDVADSYGLAFCRIDGVDLLQPASGGGWICRTRVALSVGRNPSYLRLEDSTGNAKVDSIVVVRRSDTELPRIVALDGLGSRKLDFDSLHATVAWKGTDNHRLASCRIDGSPRPLSAGGTCSLQVVLAVGGNLHRVEITDSTGNLARDSALLERSTDTAPPRLVLIGSDTVHAAFGDSVVAVRWLATDNHMVKTVQNRTWKVVMIGDTAELTLRPPVGVRSYMITAFDSTGNKTDGQVVVVRDAQAPRHRADSVFDGTPVPDTLDALGGSDSIEISRDRVTWTRVDGVAMLDAAGTWYARSWPGKAESFVVLRQAQVTENVFAGVSTSFFLRGDSLFASGKNDVGQLATGTRGPAPVTRPVFARKGVKKVVAGEKFSLLLLNTGEVLGAGEGPLPRSPQPPGKAPLWNVATGIVDIAAGRDFLLVLDEAGNVLAAGANDSGQLGTGDSTASNALVKVASKVAGIGAGWAHSIRLDSAGKVWAVGSGKWGQLGSLAGRDAAGWHLVDSTADAVFSSLGDVTLFRGKDRMIRGLGANDQGQISGGLPASVTTPQILYSMGGAWAGGGSSHVLVLLDNNDLKVAGSNQYGQIGIGVGANAWGFQFLTGGIGRAAAGRDHSLILTDSGEPQGMGANIEGELGSGDQIQRRVPTRIAY